MLWVGNFDGSSNKNLGGAKTAGPLLFDIFNTLPKEKSTDWFTEKGMAFTYIKQCKESGFMANSSCGETIDRAVPKNMKPLEICSYHQKTILSTDGTMEVCSACWTNVGHQAVNQLKFSADIAYYLRAKGVYLPETPKHNPDCHLYRNKEKSLQIIYPNLDAKLFLPRDFDGQTQPVLCKVATYQENTSVFWYINDLFLGETIGRHERHIIFPKGISTLKVIAADGSVDTRKVITATKE